MMKRITAMLLMAAMLLSLAACSSNTNSTETKDVSEPHAATESTMTTNAPENSEESEMNSL